jgi:hypothetical protein
MDQPAAVEPPKAVRRIGNTGQLEQAALDADTDSMTSRVLRSGAVWSAVPLVAGLLLVAGLCAGCGGATASVVGATTPTSKQLTRARAVVYAHAVNLRAGDLPGFSSTGDETEVPKPGRYGLEYSRCRGGVNPARRIAEISSPELSAGKALYGKIVRSTVEVWPTPAIVAGNNAKSHSPRGRACLMRFLDAVHEQMNRERKGRAQIGPFTVTIAPNPLPGVSHSFLTKINETRLLRTGAVLAHIYRDIFGFVSGPAEVELEAIGFGHPIPPLVEKEALQMLHDRATANAHLLGP